MSLRIADRVVLVDYGEVISTAQTRPDVAELLAITGVAEEAFWPVYWRYRDELDRGTLTIEEYWMRVAGDLGTSFSLATIQQLWAADYRSWISVEPGTVELLERLHLGGTRLALLSNAGFDFASTFRRSPIARLFERVFLSAEMDAVKPDPAIYLEVARELGVRPDQIVFIDNKLVNVEGARAVGAVAHHFEGVEGLRAFLEGLSSPTPA